MSEYRLTQQGPEVQEAIDKSLALTNATPVLAGKMSGPDKAKLDSINPSNYQLLLVSGTNIKTINGVSLLGSGNIQVGGVVDSALSGTSTNAIQNRVVKNALDAKQDIISDLQTIRTSSANAYQKPGTGIPYSDLSASVQSAINAALTAVQVETDPTVPAWAKATNKPTYSVSELTDDSTHRWVTDTEKSSWTAKQEALVSGTNIKTVNGQSILGSGNITVATEGIVSVTTQMDGIVDFTFSSGDVVKVDFNHSHPGLLPSVTTTDNGKILRVAAGSWSVTPDTHEPNDTTISIQMNGSVVDSFTTNASQAKTIDLGTVLTQHQSLSGYQTTGNLVTSVSSSSTDAQYPSAKCMYDLLGDVETLINAL